jgi:hypothetical protein
MVFPVLMWLFLQWWCHGLSSDIELIIPIVECLEVIQDNMSYENNFIFIITIYTFAYGNVKHL